jgi:hypothetical protein
VCEDNAYVSYLEGCTAPSYDKNQLHAAVVELWTGEGAEIKYSTVQNWWVCLAGCGSVAGCAVIQQAHVKGMWGNRSG